MERTYVHGYEGAGAFVMEIEYILSVAEMASVIMRSASCRQFVQWECYSAMLSHPESGELMTFWKNR